MVKPRTSEFQRRGTATMGSVRLGSVKLPSGKLSFLFYFIFFFQYKVRQLSCKIVDGSLRALVPDRKEPPIMGLKSNKNFIVANAVENILSGGS